MRDGGPTMKYLFQYPEPTGIDRDLLDGGEIIDVAVNVERSGWDGFAFTEHPAPGDRWLTQGGGHQTLDPFVALGAAAAVTSRITLLTYLAVMPYRNPLLLAKAATTVDRVSHGRFVLGVGTGYLKSEFFALGVDFDERNALFDEALDVLPLHWSGEPFSYKGLHFDARDIIGRPTPTNRSIPIWIGGNSQLTRRRVAQRAQGWMPMSGPPELATTARTAHLATLDDIAGAIRELRDAAGERASGIDIMIVYTDPSILDAKPDVERHRETLAQIAGTGASWVSFAFDITSASHTADFIEGFGETYLGSHRL